MPEAQTLNPEKFQNPDITAKGEKRAIVRPTRLQTLWFNTGTLCNLECENCYIESSPKNDRLVYITVDDVKPYLDEISELEMGTQEIAFTGGEPFMNKSMLDILELTLSYGFEALVLTNAMMPMQKKQEGLIKLKEKYGNKLKIRVSLDHYSEKLHEKERGPRSWKPAIEGLVWLARNDFDLSIAGRTLWNEDDPQMREGFKSLFSTLEIGFDVHDPERLVLFPEMDERVDVPEITVACWGILNINPADIMCATSRMIVKRKGESKAKVLACTLLPYDPQFEMGSTLKEGFQTVKLNHPHCAKFCVLGGGSCSKAD